jgi:hypothetical protein
MKETQVKEDAVGMSRVLHLCVTHTGNNRVLRNVTENLRTHCYTVLYALRLSRLAGWTRPEAFQGKKTFHNHSQTNEIG